MENVSIKDVARIAGVSIATVSRCINSPEQVRQSTRSRVQRAIRETGYSMSSSGSVAAGCISCRVCSFSYTGSDHGPVTA